MASNDGVVTDLSLLDGLATTRAIRRYTNEPIPEADLNKMLFAATRAPSGSVSYTHLTLPTILRV